MRRNFPLITMTTILSMVAHSHTAIYFPQIPTSELIKPYCNATNNLDVFPHDFIPLQSNTPIELPPDTLYCEASTISNDTKNMSSVLGAAAESSLHVAHVASPTLKECLTLIVPITLMLGLLAFTCKIASRKKQLQQRRRRESMSNDSGSSDPRNSMHYKKFYMDEFVVSVLRKDWARPYKRDLSLNIYLLKEAFEELERHPDIYEDPDLYDFACEFMLETVKRVAFMKIPSDRKVVWLKNRYNRNMFHWLVDEKFFF